MTASDAERKLRELSFLHEVAQLASSARDWDEMLRIVIDRTTDAMRVEVSSLYLLERREGVLRLVATNGLNRKFIGKATLRVGEGITGWVANARVPAAVRQVRADPRFKWVPGVDEERFTSMLSVPLLIHDEVVGVVNVQSVAERGFDLDEIEYLQTIANLVAGIIEKGRLQREAERKLREVSALFEVSNILTSTLELDEVLSLLVARLVRVYPGSAGAVFLRDGDELRERARSGGRERRWRRPRVRRSTKRGPSSRAIVSRCRSSRASASSARSPCECRWAPSSPMRRSRSSARSRIRQRSPSTRHRCTRSSVRPLTACASSSERGTSSSPSSRTTCARRSR